LPSAVLNAPQALYSQYHVANLIWSAANMTGIPVAGSGWFAWRANRVELHTGVNPNSSAVAHSSLEGFNRGNQIGGVVDFSHKIIICGHFETEGNDVQKVGRIQFLGYVWAAQAPLTDKGVGIEIDNYAVYGEAYGTARQIVYLLTATDGYPAYFQIVITPNVSVSYYINGALAGIITGAGVPTGLSIDNEFVTGVNNGAAGGVACFVDCGDFIILYSMIG
jgi:hypothetical protein